MLNNNNCIVTLFLFKIFILYYIYMNIIKINYALLEIRKYSSLMLEFLVYLPILLTWHLLLFKKLFKTTFEYQIMYNYAFNINKNCILSKFTEYYVSLWHKNVKPSSSGCKYVYFKTSNMSAIIKRTFYYRQFLHLSSIV